MYMFRQDRCNILFNKNNQLVESERHIVSKPQGFVGGESPRDKDIRF